MACDRQIAALTACYRKHPRQAEVTTVVAPLFCSSAMLYLATQGYKIWYMQLICKSIEAAASWCVMHHLCPEQGIALPAVPFWHGSICKGFDALMQAP